MNERRRSYEIGVGHSGRYRHWKNEHQVLLKYSDTTLDADTTLVPQLRLHRGDKRNGDYVKYTEIVNFRLICFAGGGDENNEMGFFSWSANAHAHNVHLMHKMSVMPSVHARDVRIVTVDSQAELHVPSPL